MALFIQYLRQRRGLWAAGGLFVLIFLLCFRLYRLPMKAVLYPALLCAALGLVLGAVDFWRRKRRHEMLQSIATITDSLTGPFPPAGDMESRDYQDILRRLGREHREQQARAAASYADMVDYYTVWAHQIKTPIASMRLQLQNEDSALSRALSAELQRVEQYVEMVLTFLRLDGESTDYVFREYGLDDILRPVLRKFSYDFINRRLRLDYEPVGVRVVTDEKWLSFVLEQLLSNALKYTRSGSIAVVWEEGQLLIRDTGMGIAPEDLPRIFEKGYTGYNGRRDKKASGIGLYLCRRICDRLGHGLAAESVVDQGTTMRLDFAQYKFTGD